MGFFFDNDRRSEFNVDVRFTGVFDGNHVTGSDVAHGLKRRLENRGDTDLRIRRNGRVARFHHRGSETTNRRFVLLPQIHQRYLFHRETDMNRSCSKIHQQEGAMKLHGEQS